MRRHGDTEHACSAEPNSRRKRDGRLAKGHQRARQEDQSRPNGGQTEENPTRLHAVWITER